MAFHFAFLPSRQVLRIAGPEATGFLQGLISNDIERAIPGKAIYAALLSAQGKLQFDFLVIGAKDGSYLLDVERRRADELIRKLKLYRLRAKVTIDPSEHQVAALFARDLKVQLPFESAAVLDPRLEALGWRLYALPDDMPSTEANASEEDYVQHRLALCVPEGASEFGDERLFLLEANFEELNGVDFKKGCYVGQELTARMKHKTELKKRLLPFRVAAQPAPGTSLTADGRELGQVIGGRDTTAFALVRLDRLADVKAASLLLGDEKVSPIQPAYLAGPAA